eukprot:scaffold31546_cov66-Phaeocystis_antarctica.AAC.14
MTAEPSGSPPARLVESLRQKERNRELDQWHEHGVAHKGKGQLVEDGQLERRLCWVVLLRSERTQQDFCDIVDERHPHADERGKVSVEPGRV